MFLHELPNVDETLCKLVEGLRVQLLIILSWASRARAADLGLQTASVELARAANALGSAMFGPLPVPATASAVPVLAESAPSRVAGSKATVFRRLLYLNSGRLNLDPKPLPVPPPPPPLRLCCACKCGCCDPTTTSASRSADDELPLVASSPRLSLEADRVHKTIELELSFAGSSEAVVVAVVDDDGDDNDIGLALATLSLRLWPD